MNKHNVIVRYNIFYNFRGSYSPLDLSDNEEMSEMLENVGAGTYSYDSITKQQNQSPKKVLKCKSISRNILIHIKNYATC